VADGIFTLIDVLTPGRCVNESRSTDTGIVLTDFTWSAILLLVATWLTGAVYADLSLQTILV
jgi:hypothetical protein